MNVLLLVVLAIPGGLATTLIAAQRRAAFAVGLATAIAALVAATGIGVGDGIVLAGSTVGGSDGLRLLAVAWAASILLFGVIDGLLGHGPEVLGTSLIGLGLGGVGLSVADAGVGFALLAAAGAAMAVAPTRVARPGGDHAATLGMGFLRPVIAAAALTLLAVTWGASPIGPFAAGDPPGAADPALRTLMGLGLLVIAGAFAIRAGAFPAHAWAARFVEALPASAVPPLLGWGAAAFGIVALGWVDVTLTASGSDLAPERAIVAFAGIAGVVLAGVAAILHDDLEHILAYAIVQDAGIALLAFASPRAEAGVAGRDWLLASAAVTAAFAAWVLVTRATFGGARRLPELRGWARRSPVLGLAFAFVMLGAIGLPGMAAFGARGTLIDLAVPGPIAAVALLAAFAPVLYLGRILVAGTDAMAESVRLATHAGPRRPDGAVDGWATGASPLGKGLSAVRVNRHPLAASAVVLAALLGLATASTGLGSTSVSSDGPGGSGAGGVAGPSPSASASQ
jgi:formate hydrogenlyase subunit 3/multisubunit Na+/H+ antiporter MnhD subunit